MIILANHTDIATIQHIAQETWPSTYHYLPQGQIAYMLDMMYAYDSLEKQMNDGHTFFLFLHNDIAIGFASVSKENDAIYKLNKLYVLPTIQKTGAGKALLQQAIVFAKSKQGQYLQLQVNRDNNAQAFYVKHGFTIITTADFDIGNGYYMNDYIMQLTL